MARGGANGGPQYSPTNISLTGGDGQNPKNPELKYRGLGYRTTGETNAQAQAAPIKAKPVATGGRMSSARMRGTESVPLDAPTQFADEDVMEGTAMRNPKAAVLPMATENPDYQAIMQYLPAMEWWASLPDTPQTTKDYVRYLRTVI